MKSQQERRYIAQYWAYVLENLQSGHIRRFITKPWGGDANI